MRRVDIPLGRKPRKGREEHNDKDIVDGGPAITI